MHSSLWNAIFTSLIGLIEIDVHQADYKVEEFFWGFFNLDLVGEHSAPMYLLFAPYTDL